METKPVILATRYLQVYWTTITQSHAPPPMDLTEAVIQAVMVVGYRKQTVEKLADAYRRREVDNA